MSRVDGAKRCLFVVATLRLDQLSMGGVGFVVQHDRLCLGLVGSIVVGGLQGVERRLGADGRISSGLSRSVDDGTRVAGGAVGVWRFYVWFAITVHHAGGRQDPEAPAFMSASWSKARDGRGRRRRTRLVKARGGRVALWVGMGDKGSSLGAAGGAMEAMGGEGEGESEGEGEGASAAEAESVRLRFGTAARRRWATTQQRAAGLGALVQNPASAAVRRELSSKPTLRRHLRRVDGRYRYRYRYG